MPNCSQFAGSRETCEGAEQTHELACVQTAAGECVEEVVHWKPSLVIPPAFHRNYRDCFAHWDDGLVWWRGRCMRRTDRSCHHTPRHDGMCDATRGCVEHAGACVPVSYSNATHACPQAGGYGTPCYRDRLYLEFLARKEWCPTSPAAAAAFRGLPGHAVPCSVFGLEACAEHCLKGLRADECTLQIDAADSRTCIATGCTFLFTEGECLRSLECDWTPAKHGDGGRCGAGGPAPAAPPPEGPVQAGLLVEGSNHILAAGAAGVADAAAGAVGPATNAGAESAGDAVMHWVLAMIGVVVFVWLAVHASNSMVRACREERRTRDREARQKQRRWKRMQRGRRATGYSDSESLDSSDLSESSDWDQSSDSDSGGKTS